MNLVLVLTKCLYGEGRITHLKWQKAFPTRIDIVVVLSGVGVSEVSVGQEVVVREGEGERWTAIHPLPSTHFPGFPQECAIYYRVLVPLALLALLPLPPLPPSFLFFKLVLL